MSEKSAYTEDHFIDYLMNSGFNPDELTKDNILRLARYSPVINVAINYFRAGSEIDWDKALMFAVFLLARHNRYLEDIVQGKMSLQPPSIHLDLDSIPADERQEIIEQLKRIKNNDTNTDHKT